LKKGKGTSKMKARVTGNEKKFLTKIKLV